MYQTFLLAGAVTLVVLWLTLRFLAKRKVQNLHTKYVFITGCDSGFGRETAIRLDKMGVHVLAACLTKQGAQDLKSMTSDKLKTFQMDVTDSQQIKDVFRQVKNLLPSGQGKEKCLPRRPHKMTGVIRGNSSCTNLPYDPFIFARLKNIREISPPKIKAAKFSDLYKIHYFFSICCEFTFQLIKCEFSRMFD